MMNLNNLEAYEIIREEDIKDIGIKGIFLIHKKTKAKVALLPCQDENKVFNIIFRTPPKDSCGTAHIVEHTVLCGSDKYPLKDPFVELVKGSFNTFLNAMTFPDKTMYPVASTNDKDFRNLLEVYLDAVFRPNIYKEKNIFLQEGWGYRLKDADSPLNVSGVVYNEMKGVFSSADDMMEYEINKALYPDTIYSYESGGDPEVIPELSYEQFLDFHRNYYHPSNSYIYIYGNADMESILKYIDEEYLSKYDYLKVDSEIYKQEPFASCREVIADYPVSEEEDDQNKSMLSYNIVMGDCFNIKESIAIDAIDYALFSAQGAPIRQKLLDEKIGDTILSSFVDGIYQPNFEVVAKNASCEDKDRFKEIILSELERIAGEGIDKQSLLARINNLEFSFREADYGTYPKGLMYSFCAMDTWLYDDDQPFTELYQLKAFDELKKEIENDTGYFENIVREKFINNPHAAIVVLNPKKGLAVEKDKVLAKKLADYKAALSDEEISEIVEATRLLKEYQEKDDSEEAKASLPTLTREDIKKEPKQISNIVEKEIYAGRDIEYIRHDTDTNGINYVEIMLPADNISVDKLKYFSLMKSALTSVNTEKHSYLELSNAINMNLGGLGFSIDSYKDPDDRKSYRPIFSIKFKSLFDKTKDGFDLLKEILLTSDFDDEKRLYEIISEIRASLKVGLPQSGHSTAVLRANSYHNSAMAFNDSVKGITFYDSLCEIYNSFDALKDKIAQELYAVLEKILISNKLYISITADEEGYTIAKNCVHDFVNAVSKNYPACANESVSRVKAFGALNEGIITSGQVQYAAKTGNYRDAGLVYDGSLFVLRHILNYDYLWNTIRVNGNAYGCGCNFFKNGLTTFMSYRDPKLKETLDAFDHVVEYLDSFEADESTMTKYIIGALSNKDFPLTPSLFGAYSLMNYMNGVSYEDLQRERNEILSTDAAKIRYLRKYIEAALCNNTFCVVGSESAVNENKEIFGVTRQLG